MIKKWSKTLTLFLIISLFCYSYSQQDKLDIFGYFQSGAGVFHTFEKTALSNTYYVGRSTLRFNFSSPDNGFAKFEGSADFSILSGVYTKDYIIQSNFLKIGEETLLTIDIRKIYLVIKPEIFDLYVGRQLIKFGEGMVFSPLDPFSKIDFTDVYFTRLGVDCLRVKIPLGEVDYFEFTGLPRSEWTNSDCALRTGFNIYAWDFSIVGYYRGKYNFASYGFSFKGDIIAGVYGEFVYHFLREEEMRFWNLMFSFDYSFLEKFIVRMEYYYNSFDINKCTFVELVYPFVSKQYLMAQLIFTPNLIDTLVFSFIDNLENEALLILFSYQRNLYQNVNLVFNVRYSKEDLKGLNVINLNSLYYSIEVNVRY